jgi:molybdopterin-guanine dinucleotide biosynthesis protein A
MRTSATRCLSTHERSGTSLKMNAIILAGGLSRRMNGTRKAFLRLGNESFIERILRLVKPFTDAAYIVTNEPDLYARFDARSVADERQGVGPLMGIYSGLKASGSERNFVTAVDTPLLSPALARHLCEAGDQCDAAVPRWKAGMEPLCAVYARRCLPAIESVLDQGRIVGFFPLIRTCFIEESAVRELDPEGLSFFNVNTPEDYFALVTVHAGRPTG